MSSPTKFAIYPVASQETAAASTTSSTYTTAVSGIGSSITKTSTATTDTTPPVPGGSGALQFTGLAPNGVGIGWASATDDTTAQGVLEYQVFYSTVKSDVDTLAPSGVGTVGGVPTGAAIASLSATSIGLLTPLTTYWANVVVTDAAGNAAIYTAGSFTTLVAPDTTAPVAGGSGLITFSNVSTTSLSVNWTAATDETTAPSSLQYEVYRSTSNNIDTLENAQAHGTAVFTTSGSPAWQVNITTAAVTGLSAGTTYYFNVLVRDAAGNPRAYVTNSQVTTQPAIYLFATSGHNGSMGGRSGADAICAAQRPTSVCPSATTNSIHAMLSFSSSDMIKNMQTTTFNAVGAGNPIAMSSTAAIKTSNGTQIASNFSSLLSNGSSVNIATALSISASLSGYGYWTGATSDGGYTSSVGGYDPTCTGWTSATSNLGPLGMTANQTVINNASGFFTGGGFWYCNEVTHPILCLCW